MSKKVQIGPYAVFRSKKDFDECVAGLMSEYVANYIGPHRKDAYDKGLESGTTYGLDMAIMALGRMGVKLDWVEFMKHIGDAAKDYGELFDIDLEENHDKDYWWSGSKLDKELYEYISPDIYPSFEERYKREKIEPAKITPS